jgi:hypothetical protein
MLPPDAIVEAASRWIRLLRVSTLEKASRIIRADPSYTDITRTQYSSGLDWLRKLEFLDEDEAGGRLASAFVDLPDLQLNQLFFERLLEAVAPPWLQDADLLVPDPAELPQDVASVAASLGLNEVSAFASVIQVRGRIDLEQRARIGNAGECELVDYLEYRWPKSTVHVAKNDDGFGYDVLFRHGEKEWHLEVKSTTRRGRLVIYLSRHEYEIGRRDPFWRLLVVGLDKQLRLQVIATVRHTMLWNRTPGDRSSQSKWQTASYELTSSDLYRGLDFLSDTDVRGPSCTEPSCEFSQASGSAFAWLP